MCAPKAQPVPAALGCWMAGEHSRQGSTAGRGRALGWQQEAGVCSWLCAKGASQAMGTALPGQGCECQVQAVPLRTWGWHQTQLPAASGPALSQLLPLWPVSPKSPGMWPYSVQFAHLAQLWHIRAASAHWCVPQGGSPVSHCSVQHMVVCAPVPTSACFPVLLGLLLAMTCCCGEMLIWHLPSVTQHRLCCARQT